MHLRNAPAKGMLDMGYSVGYKYAHDFPEHYVDMQFLPDEMVGTKYYEPGNLGYEVQIRKWMDHLKNGTPLRKPDSSSDTSSDKSNK